MGSPADLRRPLPRYLQWTIGLIAALFIVGLAWEVTVGMQQSRLYDQTVRWAADTQRSIRLDPQFSTVRVDVALRFTSFQRRSFYPVVLGVVLNDAEEAELRSRIEALTPPKPLRWGIINCYGDERHFNLLRDIGEPAPPPLAP